MTQLGCCDRHLLRKLRPLQNRRVVLYCFCIALFLGAGVTQLLGKPPVNPAMQLTPSSLPPIDVMPLPATVQLRDGSLPVTQAFMVALTGYTEPRLHRAAERFLHNLSLETGLPVSLSLTDPKNATLVIHTQRASKPIQELGESESYTLDVDSSSANLAAETPLGALRGLETFLQLVKATPNGFAAPAVHIDDKPRFPWRGLMIDVSRHFIPLPVLRRNLDAMAAVKMNVLHLHLSDDQGFRVESKVFPALQGKGSDGLFYTQSEIRDLIVYARDRGIRIVPEFDMPGHTIAWFVGYPHLASGPGPFQVERKWGVFDPAMDPTREETYVFLNRFIAEMAALFPDPYFHIGGDEVNGKQWDANSRIRSFMRAHALKSDGDLQRYFTHRVERIVRQHHKVMVGWDEVLTPGIPKGIVIQSWRGPKSLAEAAQQGYRGILSSGYYLDAMQPAARHYQVDPLSTDGAALSADQQQLVLGGEACMWAEFVSEANIDSRIWPRTAAIAERLWSPQSLRDDAAMYIRLDALSSRLQWLGITHRSGYAAMLARMFDAPDLPAATTLGDVLEPVGLGAREETAMSAGAIQTSQMPLNRMVDTVAPESDTARRFSNAVDRWIAGGFSDKQAETQLRSQLLVWRDNDARLAPALRNSFLLHELAPLSQRLSSLGDLALQALDHIDNHEAPSESWTHAQLEVIQQSQKPTADLTIAIAPAIQKLVEASAKSTTPK